MELNRVSVAYLLVRSSRRSIGMEVSAQGLTVRAPLRASHTVIESVLREKTRWILQKLSDRAVRVDSTPRVHWQDGSSMPFLGGELQLRLHPQAPRTGELLSIGPQRWVLHLCADVEASAEQVRAVVAAWWLRHARQLLTERLQHYAPAMGVQWRSLRLSNARTRWGSAKADGSIMLNWRLLHYRLPVLDYVVIHELAHLRHMDHSPHFWAVVESVCPDYLQLRQALKQPCPDWAI
ncbi:M48 family metallopeptidase [Comamonas kerstersii]|uniref:M48 family metallopeptidase n=1 Tax=Comamonas kerstersii TaxID=225992 RepID=UPI002670341F|nr:SprT family zinc-dependent metalloprotease [Comamonas kerstersii]